MRLTRWVVTKATLMSLSLTIALATTSVQAETFIWVPNATLIKYMESSGDDFVLRNLSDFSSYALGCCYNYWIDTSTSVGKSQLAILMAAMGQQTGLYIGIPDNLQSGKVIDIGVW